MSLLNNWMVHLLALLLVFVFFPPNMIMRKIAEMFDVHFPVALADVESVQVAKVVFDEDGHVELREIQQEVPQEQWEPLLTEFGKASFISKKEEALPMQPRTAILVQLKSDEPLVMYSKGDDFDVVRTVRNKRVHYWVRSQSLHDKVKTFS